MIEIMQFPKKCPHCKTTLEVIKKTYQQWMECPNQDCPYLQTGPMGQHWPYMYANTCR